MTVSDELLVVIPMKDPKAAKTRLAAVLDDTERHDFAVAMFQRTLDVIESANRAQVKILVVTESAKLANLCRQRSISVLNETRREGLNAACTIAAKWALDHQFSRMAIVPADLALLSTKDIEYLASFPIKSGEIAICEATDGGTNCLMLSPPDAIPFQYGPSSFKAHRRAAMAAGRICHVMRESDMRFDIDTSEDLQQFRQSGRDNWVVT